jgi:hypothetical protein
MFTSVCLESRALAPAFETVLKRICVVGITPYFITPLLLLKCTPTIDDTMIDIEKRVLRLPPSGNYLVSLFDHVDLPTFKATLPADIQSKIITEWCVVNAKGIAGTFYSWLSFYLWFLTSPGPFDEDARSFLAQHSDVKRIDGDGFARAASRNQ